MWTLCCWSLDSRGREHIDDFGLDENDGSGLYNQFDVMLLELEALTLHFDGKCQPAVWFAVEVPDTTPNREQVEQVKQNWLDDPCYDLGGLMGYELYDTELRAFQARKEAEWEAERIERRKGELSATGLKLHPAAAEYVADLKNTVDWLKERVTTLENKFNGE